LGLADPVTAVIIAFCFLGVMLYKRINLGITLNATAIVLALLALDWAEIPKIIYNSFNPSTLEGQLAISVVLATFGIMWLSELYQKTGVILNLSESLSRIVKNSKIVLSVLPAVLGLLPVAGGALMSAPIVELEAEKLKMKAEKKAYVNVWFRHLILPIYPLSPFLIITVALTGVAASSLILRQIPIVAAMVVVGYFVGFWKVQNSNEKEESKVESEAHSGLIGFVEAFLPILATIVVAVLLDLVSYEFSRRGFDVLIATFAGIAVLAIISKASPKVLAKPLKTPGIYGVTFAAFGAFLLRNVMNASGISEVFKPLVTSGNVDVAVPLTVIPMVVGFLTGSPSGAVAIGTSVLSGVLTFSPKTATLLYISAYLGYVAAPTHLCFTFTAEYFKSPLGKVYKYLIPSFLATFAAAVLLYFLPV
jgi:integral membrane protein (TIGR00529 family)